MKVQHPSANRASQTKGLELAILISLILAGVSLQSWESATAATGFIGDTSMVYAHVATHSTLYQGDMISIYMPPALYGSIINWANALAYRYLDIVPEASHLWLNILQNMLIGLGSFALVTRATRLPYVGLLGMLFVYAALPWGWNLANYEAKFPELYPANFALAIALLALMALLAGRRWPMLGLLWLAGLAHPGMGLYACAFAGMFWLWTAWQTGERAALVNTALVCGVVGLIVAPSLIVSAQAQGNIPDEIARQATLDNGHFNPFTVSLQDWTRLHIILKWTLLGMIAITSPIPLHVAYRRLWWGALLVTVGLFVVHYIAIQTEQLTLIRVGGHRATALFAVLTVPGILAYFYGFFVQRQWVGMGFALLTVLLAVSERYGLSWLLILGFILVELSRGQFLGLRIRLTPQLARVLTLVGALVLMASYSAILADTLPDVTITIAEPVIWFTVPGLALAVGYGLLRRFPAIWRVAAVAILIPIAWYAVQQTVNTSDTPEFRALYAAQRWANQHTAPDATFAGNLTRWRVFAQRPYLYMNPDNIYYVYFMDERLLNHQIDLLGWYGLSFDERGRYFEDNLFGQLSAQEWVALREAQGIDYVIMHRTEDRYEWNGTLHFQIAYENDTYIIYDLHSPYNALINDIDQQAAQAWSDRTTISRESDGYFFDAEGGFNSLRPLILLDYRPTLQRDYRALLRYAAEEDRYNTALWNTPTPAPYLRRMGIRYVYVDDRWWATTSETARGAFAQADQFREVLRYEANGQFRSVYEIVAEPAPFHLRYTNLPTELTVQALHETAWHTAIAPDARILLPADNYATAIADAVPQITELSTVQADPMTLNLWRETRDADALSRLGFDYVLVDDIWWQFLSPDEQQTLQASMSLVREWSVGTETPFFRLYARASAD